jgi:O-glycosyl hydrolase
MAMLLLVPAYLPVIRADGADQAVTISMTLDASKKYQTIEGFGANLNPLTTLK